MKILVIADIHGNATALEAVLNKEHDADRTIFLGDAVLPGPQPNETITLMRTLSAGPYIVGNHDTEMLHPEIFANYPAQWLAFFNWVVDNFEPEGLEFLRTFQPPGEFEEDGIPMRLHHGLVEGGPRHTLPDSPDENFHIIAAGSDCPYVLSGHTHVQFTRVIGEQTFINPGSVGQNRCGKQVACYGLFEDGVYRQCEVPFDTRPWLDAFDKIDTMDAFPDFKVWIRDGLINGYGVGQSEPWTRYAAEGCS